MPNASIRIMKIASLFFRKLWKRNKEATITSNILIGLFKDYERGKVSLYIIALLLKYSDRWIRELYRRYKAGKPLWKEKGHCKKKLDEKQTKFIRKIIENVKSHFLRYKGTFSLEQHLVNPFLNHLLILFTDVPYNKLYVKERAGRKYLNNCNCDYIISFTKEVISIICNKSFSFTEHSKIAEKASYIQNKYQLLNAR